MVSRTMFASPYSLGTGWIISIISLYKTLKPLYDPEFGQLQGGGSTQSVQLLNSFWTRGLTTVDL